MASSDPTVSALSLGFVEALYTRYLEDPASVEPDWRRYFEGIEKDGFEKNPRLGPSFRSRSLFNPADGAATNGAAAAASIVPARESAPTAPRPQAEARSGDVSDEAVRQDRVDQLVRAYRVRGHMIAKIDPL